MSAEVALKVEDLNKSYGALNVAKNISFDLTQGTALGVIGPNGAGKTTLFNLIAGTVTPDAGRIEAFGQDLTKMSARVRCHFGISRSFQVPQPFAGLTTFENVLIAAAYGQGLSERLARSEAEAALQQTGLYAKANHRAGSLTLLDRKRLELARSIATKPRLLLLDEIAGGLTEAECHDLINLIAGIKKSGVTIIWIEHVLHALLSVVDHLLVLDFGEKIVEGEPKAIMASPEVSAIYLGLDAQELESA